MKTTVCEKTIAYGKNRYKTDGSKWWTLVFGTYSPACKGIPSWRYVPIPIDKVPKEVIAKGEL